MNCGFVTGLSRLIIAIGLIIITGCGSSVPDVLPVSGIVSIDGKPLPNAEIRFIPMAEGLDGTFVASSVTDKDGKFSLRLQGKEEPGCCACLCKVTVEDGPLPDEVREAYGTGNQRLVNRYMGSLKNRPIPEQYTQLRTTPLEYEITEAQLDMKLNLDR